MFITMPIERIEFTNNTLQINDNSFHYNISNKFDAELLESLISKGAYASALLYLNKTSLLESINETKVTKKNFKNYLQECKNLLKESVYESKASNLRPLCSINGLEILESDTNIYRGKNKLLVEDFRKSKKALEEQDIAMSDNVEDGWGDDIKDLTSEFFDKVDRVRYEIKNARRGSYGIEGDSIEDLVLVFESISEGAQELADTLRSTEVSSSDVDDLNEEAEGTQVSDIAAKKDQNVRSNVVMHSKKKKLEEYDFNVGINHNFKGFILTSEGRYERGNYVLINENGSIRAVRANMIDDYGTHVRDYNQVETEQAPRLVADLNKHFNKNYDIYDFNFRIEDNQLKVYDANEEFDFGYLDDKYEQANKILQGLFGKDAYFEAELAPIGVVAGIEIKDLN